MKISAAENRYGVRAGQVWQDRRRRAIKDGRFTSFTVAELGRNKAGKAVARGERSESGRRSSMLLSRFNADNQMYLIAGAGAPAGNEVTQVREKGWLEGGVIRETSLLAVFDRETALKPESVGGEPVKIHAL